MKQERRHSPTWRNAFLFAAAALALAAAPALADDLTSGGLPYNGITVVDVKDGSISFRTSAGSQAAKSLREVTEIQLSAPASFNKAEKLRADGNTVALSLAAYDEAGKAMTSGWQGRLLRYRRLSAAEAAGAIDKAVADWLAMMDEAVTKSNEDMRPKVGARISGGGAAIKALEAKASAVKDAAYLSAVKGLLLRLYEKEGMKDKANALALELSGAGPEKTPAGVSDRDQLRGFEALIDQGKAAEVLKDVTAKLDQYAAADLPRALLVAGKAQMKVAEGTADAAAKKKQLIAAGLELMKVYAFYPKSVEAPEALYLAGQVHMLLPNAAAAQAAFERVMKDYPSSPFAASAKSALEKGRK